jgi:hypothetical protein
MTRAGIPRPFANLAAGFEGSRQLLWNPPTFVTLSRGPLRHDERELRQALGTVDVYDLRQGLERGTAIDAVADFLCRDVSEV